MHQSGARRCGFFYVGYFRQLFVFDFDQLQRRFRDRRIVSQHRRNRITDVAYLVDRDDRLIFVGRAVFVVESLDIVAGERRDHSRKRFRFGSIDFDELRVRHRTSEDARVRHARELEIGRVDRLARDFFDAVDAVRIGARHRIALLWFHDVWLKYQKGHGENRRGR